MIRVTIRDPLDETMRYEATGPPPSIESNTGGRSVD